VVTTDSWVIGDHFGRPIPADPETLRAGGPEFLSEVFRAWGALGDGNAVSRVTRFEEIGGGSTGRKLFLTVEYEAPEPHLHNELFVKFSRDHGNPIRDRGKTQMEPEVRFAALSLAPDFPIAVPSPQFADYHRDSGTGLLVTERITFGANGIERQYHKCLDYEMPDPHEHYRALIAAIARLAGTHRSGRLPATLTQHFPVDMQAATVGEPVPMTAEKLQRRLNQLTTFTETHPTLVPDNVRNPESIARLTDEIPRIVQYEASVWDYLAGNPDYVALCHWNANVDNAWFWRESGGGLKCGLMDWGCVSQMNMGMAIWGAMSGAETELWNDHLDDLLVLFVDEFGRCGGPRLDPDELRVHTTLYAAIMGVTWLLDVPALIRARLGRTDLRDRTDPRIKDHESIRAPLQMMANFLNLLETQDVGKVLGRVAA
jgi:hypothetical protein